MYSLTPRVSQKVQSPVMISDLSTLITLRGNEMTLSSLTSPHSLKIKRSASVVKHVSLIRQPKSWPTSKDCAYKAHSRLRIVKVNTRRRRES